MSITRRGFGQGLTAVAGAKIVPELIFGANEAEAGQLKKHPGGYHVADAQMFLEMAGRSDVLVIDARRTEDVFPKKGLTIRIPEERFTRVRGEVDRINSKLSSRLANHKGPVLIYCLKGVRSKNLSALLSDHLYENQFVSLEGGLESIHGKMENAAELGVEQNDIFVENGRFT